MTTPPPTGKFSLRALVHEVCGTSTVADPTTLAKEVLDRIAPGDERAALEQALPHVVNSVVSRSRGSQSQTPPGGHASGVDDDHAAIAAGGRSTKVSAIRAMWRVHLRDRIAVGPARTDWKFLADCTADDLDYAADFRERLAAANAARAALLRELAEALRETDAAIVADLPDLAARLGGAP